MEEIEKKFLNFESLNIIYSALQGQFAANNILNQVKHPDFKEEVLSTIKSHIKEIAGKFEEFDQGSYILDPEIEEVNKQEEQLFKILEYLRTVFAQSAHSIVQIASDEKWQENTGHAQLLVAYYGWHSYSRDNYYKKQKEFYAANDREDLIPHVDLKLGRISNDIKLVGTFLQSLKRLKGPESTFFPHLLFFIKTLPGYFYSKVHDCNQLLTLKSGEFTFKAAGFTEELTDAWHNLDFSPGEAGYWVAYNFTPEVAKKWIEKGFTAAEDAADWHYSGLTPAESVTWANYLFTPILALQWREANFTPEHAAILISRGYFAPKDLPKDEKEIDALIAKGFAGDDPSGESGVEVPE